MKKCCLFFLVFFLLLGCRDERLVGSWERSINGQEPRTQGVMLRRDGTASSINMQTLVYDKWKRKGNLLILYGKSIGNGQTIDIREEYEIKELNDTALELRMGGMVVRFMRKIKPEG